MTVIGTEKLTYTARGRPGKSHLELLVDNEIAEEKQPDNGEWVESSDHTVILYKINEVNVRRGRMRISKTMLSNKRNKEEVSERYRHSLPEALEFVKRTQPGNEQDA